MVQHESSVRASSLEPPPVARVGGEPRMARRQFRIGDRVRYTNSDGSSDDGTVIGSKRKDGYYPVRFDSKAYLFGVQLVMPSHLRLIQNKK